MRLRNKYGASLRAASAAWQSRLMLDCFVISLLSMTTPVAAQEIAVNPVEEISFDSAGLYDASKGGLAADIWQGSDAERVGELLKKTGDTSLETLRKLAVRALLSEAEAPQGSEGFLEQRVEALIKLGEAGQALRLLELIPEKQRDEPARQLETTAQLSNGDAQNACSNVTENLAREDAETAYWLRLSIFCLAHAGKKTEAQLALDLAHEQGVEFSTNFAALISAMLGAPGKQLAAPVAPEDAALAAIARKDMLPKPKAPIAAKNREPFMQLFAKAVEKPLDLGAVQSARPARLYGLLNALGFQDIKRSKWLENNAIAVEEKQRTAPWLRHEIRQAAEEKRTGEAILLMLQVPVLDDETAADLTAALAQLELTKEAQEFAADAMVTLY